jgi:hypothetical protein
METGCSTIFADLREQSASALRSLSEAVLHVPSPELMSVSFNTRDIPPGSEPINLIGRIEAWVKKDHRFVYLLIADENAGLNAVHQAFADAKTHERDGRAYARLNEKSSKYFYVGSSSALGRRFREHLGYGARGTYALHLAYWGQKLELDLTLVAARYGPNVSANLVGVLEDNLWDRLKPMFGRQGRR